jgi:4-hydroxy-tetrahydrodipicolinate reductase
MKVGLFGFGRSGKAVATVLLQNQEVELCWVIRKSKNLQHRSVSEFLGIKHEDQGLIFSKDEWTPQRLLEEHPVDVIIDFSSCNAVFFYGAEAANREVSIVTAISTYPPETVAYRKELAQKTRVLWSPNITVGINFLMTAAKILKTIAPYTDIELIEEHFKKKKSPAPP